MDCQAMVGVLSEAGVEVRDQPVLPSALGLPDGARTRLLVDHDGLFRVYCAENLASTLPMSKIKGALKAAGDEALLLMSRGEGGSSRCIRRQKAKACRQIWTRPKSPCCYPACG